MIYEHHSNVRPKLRLVVSCWRKERRRRAATVYGWVVDGWMDGWMDGWRADRQSRRVCVCRCLQRRATAYF